MAKPALVTGYIPIPNHPRSAAEYGKLAEELFKSLAFPGPIIPFYQTIRDCWVDKLLRARVADNQPVVPAVADNPAKNTLAYHVVQHQKFQWLAQAARLNRQVDPLVWIDYGIGHVPGVTAAVIDDFLVRVRHNDFAIPGCWPKMGPEAIDDSQPCWRFCGGVMVVPRKDVGPLFRQVHKTFVDRLSKTGIVTWEVNTLARAEPSLHNLRWYLADHNETLFTNYGVSACRLASLPGSADQSEPTSMPN